MACPTGTAHRACPQPARPAHPGAALSAARRPWTQCSWAIAPGYLPVVLRFQRFGLEDADAVTVYAGGLDGEVLAHFTGAPRSGAAARRPLLPL